jgi:hypothetical protein
VTRAKKARQSLTVDDLQRHSLCQELNAAVGLARLRDGEDAAQHLQRAGHVGRGEHQTGAVDQLDLVVQPQALRGRGGGEEEGVSRGGREGSRAGVGS